MRLIYDASTVWPDGFTPITAALSNRPGKISEYQLFNAVFTLPTGGRFRLVSAPACPVPENDRRWIEESLDWLTEELGVGGLEVRVIRPRSSRLKRTQGEDHG